jgi:hypothetical protein
MVFTYASKMIVALTMSASLLFAGCRTPRASAPPEEGEIGPPPSVRVSLKADGLPDNFFQPGFDTECSREIIGYRFVVWLDSGHVAVGFNTSPNCRHSPDRPIDGKLRVLIFNPNGTITASRDVSYLADGHGEVVGDGQAIPGPGATLLIRFQSVNLDKDGRQECPSGVRLLDASLKDVAQIDRFLEQTTLVEHALVFQDGIVFTGPRNYSILNGPDLNHMEHRQVDWPAGARDRKFGEHEVAFIHCEQKLNPGQYTSTNVVNAGAKVRCSLNVLADAQHFWTRQLVDGQTASLVGIISDGSVVGEVHQRSGRSQNLMLWREDHDPVLLPWIPSPFVAEINSTTRDFSRYALFATSDAHPCNPLSRILGVSCDDVADGRWFIFDRIASQPIVNRVFPKSGRAALSPDGLHYASFEAGELRIYSLSK